MPRLVHLSGLMIACGAGWLLGCSPQQPSVAPPKCPAPTVSQPIEVATESDEPGPLQVAITVADLPAHGPLVPGLPPVEIHRAMLSAFEAHGVPQVYGFVNAGKLERAPELRAALEAWTAAGHPLGNHTFSHLSLRKADLGAYFRDIAANEPLLDGMALEGHRLPTFRYPFLLEGMSREDTVAIREHLDQRGYRIAPVTIDFYNWAFNPPYARCRAIADETALKALRKTFVEHAIEMLEWSDAAALDLYGRRTPHVLLLHAGAFDAEMIEQLLGAMEDHGVEWVSLDDALADPVYAEQHTMSAPRLIRSVSFRTHGARCRPARRCPEHSAPPDHMRASAASRSPFVPRDRRRVVAEIRNRWTSRAIRSYFDYRGTEWGYCKALLRSRSSCRLRRRNRTS